MVITRILSATALVGALVLAPGLATAKTAADQLVIGLSMNNLLSLDPAGATGNDSSEINANLYDMLVELDPVDTYKVLPGLAESWTISPDGNTLTFKIRSGVKSHAGNVMSAEDAAWSLQRVLKLNLALASVWKAYGFTAENVADKIRATDASTLVINLPEPTDPKLVLYTLGASPSAFILDRQAVLAHEVNGDLGKQWLTTNAAGSGPFKFGEWRAKDVLTINRFDDYWKGATKLRRVVMRHMTESQSLRLMLERGDIDIARGLSVPDVEALKKNDALTVESVQRGNVYYVALSMKDARFADKRVREAIRDLIDYDGINKTVMPNYGVYHQRPVQLGLPATLPNPGYKLDVAKAKTLLAEAGYGGGFKTTIQVLSDPPFLNIATNLQATLAQAGIEASVVSGTGNQVYGAMRDRKFEIIVGRGGGGLEPHPHSSLRALVYNPDNRDEAKLTNFQGWRTSFISPKINELIEKAEVERDPTKQTAMYQDVQKLYDEEIGAITPVSQMIETVVLQKDVKHYVSHPSATTRLREVEKAR